MLGWGRDGDPLEGVDPADLRTVLNAAFQQRRKMLRGSLKGLINSVGGQPLPEEWGKSRPEELDPRAFLALTRMVFGERGKEKNEDNVKGQRAMRERGECEAGVEGEGAWVVGGL